MTSPSPFVPFHPKTLQEQLYYMFIGTPPQFHEEREGGIISTSITTVISNGILTMSSLSATILFLLLRYNKNLKYNFISSIIAIILCIITVLFTTRIPYSINFYRNQIKSSFLDKDPDALLRYDYTMGFAQYMGYLFIFVTILLLIVVVRAIIHDFKRGKIRY